MNKKISQGGLLEIGKFIDSSNKCGYKLLFTLPFGVVEGDYPEIATAFQKYEIFFEIRNEE